MGDDVVEDRGPEAPKAKKEVPRIHKKEIEVSLKTFESILPPVFATMLLSAVFVLYITPNAAENFGDAAIIAFDENNADDNNEAAGLGLLNALIIVGVITIMTFVIVMCIYFRCERIFKGYLVFALLMLMGFTTATMILEGLSEFNVPTDWFTFVFFFLNYAVVGALAIFSYEFGLQGEDRLIPYGITQVYLVFVSVTMAWLVTTIFPDFTVWALLVALALYDLCAVLTPCGPLNLLLKVVTQRQEEDEKRREANGEAEPETQKQLIPGLLFETSTGRSKGMKKFENRKKKKSADAGAAAGLNFSVMIVTETDDDDDEAKEGDDEAKEKEEKDEEVIEDKIEKEEVIEEPEEKKESEKEVRTGLKELTGDDAEAAREEVDEEKLKLARRKAYLKMKKEHDEFLEKLEASNLKLGLGDFVFYSVLTAKSAEFGFIAFVSVAIVVLCGLCGTLILLSVFQKALPALPISILLGVLTYVIVLLLVSPFADGLTLNLATI